VLASTSEIVRDHARGLVCRRQGRDPVVGRFPVGWGLSGRSAIDGVPIGPGGDEHDHGVGVAGCRWLHGSSRAIARSVGRTASRIDARQAPAARLGGVGGEELTARMSDSRAPL